MLYVKLCDLSNTCAPEYTLWYGQFLNRESYTSGHLIWNLRKQLWAIFINFIDCDNEFKILFIKWLFKMEFYHLKYFNRKHSVVTDGIMKLGGSNQVLCNMWFYNFQCHVVMLLINSSVRLQIFLSHTDFFLFPFKIVWERIFLWALAGWFNNLTWNEPAHLKTV